jgi:hypothetical protein
MGLMHMLVRLLHFAMCKTWMGGDCVQADAKSPCFPLAALSSWANQSQRMALHGYLRRAIGAVATTEQDLSCQMFYPQFDGKGGVKAFRSRGSQACNECVLGPQLACKA